MVHPSCPVIDMRLKHGAIESLMCFSGLNIDPHLKLFRVWGTDRGKLTISSSRRLEILLRQVYNHIHTLSLILFTLS